MQTKVQKWGNSLAFRIPSAFAREMGIGADDSVDVAVKDGRLVIALARAKKYSLVKLLSKVTKKNIHKSVDTDHAVGNEVW